LISNKKVWQVATYELNEDRGYIRLFQPMSENEVLALHFTTTRGNIFGESQAQFLADSASGRQRMRLMLIKGANPKADTARYIGKTWELDDAQRLFS
jgi:hypothetical protein